MKGIFLFGGVALVACAAAALGGGQGRVPGTLAAGGLPATATAANVDAAKIEALVGRLKDADFSVREAAEKQLANLPFSTWESLSAIAAKTSDPEARARLEDVLATVDQRHVLEMPAISLDLKDATGDEVAAALSKAMGVPMWAEGTSAERFTLKVVDQPFWEVIRKLAEQHPIWPVPEGSGTALRPRAFARMLISGGVAVSCRELPPHGDADGACTIEVGIDPRVSLQKLYPLTIQSASDENGMPVDMKSDFLAGVGQPAPVPPKLDASELDGIWRQFNPHYVTTHQCSEVFETETVHSLAMKCEVELVLQLAAATGEIADKQVNQPVVVGDSVVILRERIQVPDAKGIAGLVLQIKPKDSASKLMAVPAFIGGDDTMTLKEGVDLSGAGGDYSQDSELGPGGTELSAGSEDGSCLHVQVADGAGKHVADYWIAHGVPMTSVHIVDANFKEPLTFKIEVPQRIRKVVMPFEFKDVVVRR